MILRASSANRSYLFRLRVKEAIMVVIMVVLVVEAWVDLLVPMENT